MNNEKTVLITGATGGIGRALCREFACRGYRLILTGRSPARLEKQAAALGERYGTQVVCHAADLGQPGAAQGLCNRLAGEQVDVLVNNAGFGLWEPFAQNTPGVLEEMLQVNIGAVTRFCRSFLPGMLARGAGKILNVSSIGGFVPGPGNAVYCATKSYVLSLSRALAEECAGTGVTVTALCPGATLTGFARRAEMESSLLFRRLTMSPRQVAGAAYQGLMAGKSVVVPGATNKMIHLFSRVAPSNFAARTSGMMQRPGE